MFIGVIIGPLLAPRFVRRFGVRNLLLVCFALDIVLILALKVFDSIAAWFVLRALLGWWDPASSPRARHGSISSPATSDAAGSSASMPPRCRLGSAPGR